MCSCPGDCEGGPECLDDEGGPLADHGKPSTDPPPPAAVLLAACEAMAMLIWREYSGDGCAIADDVATFTEATPEQVEAVAALDAYWAKRDDPVRSLMQGFAASRKPGCPQPLVVMT